jgi:L,D-peptidoglycan transpeptidase YkuD (ErfK/YbiS/YcfS/YnhG family)
MKSIYPAYSYGMMLSYNKENSYKKDYAIFLHCYSGRKYTLGCIAIPKKCIKKVIRNSEKGTRICIYKK